MIFVVCVGKVGEKSLLNVVHCAEPLYSKVINRRYQPYKKKHESKVIMSKHK